MPCEGFINSNIRKWISPSVIERASFYVYVAVTHNRIRMRTGPDKALPSQLESEEKWTAEELKLAVVQVKDQTVFLFKWNCAVGNVLKPHC